MRFTLKAASAAAIGLVGLLGGAVLATQPTFASGTDIREGVVKLDAFQTREMAEKPLPRGVSIIHNADGSTTILPLTHNDSADADDSDGDALVDQTADMDGQSYATLRQAVLAEGAAGELDEQTQCLAGAVYFESKGESLAGQLAVARVVINRANSGRFPDTLCGVVYQRSQFSFVHGHEMPAIKTGSTSWRRAVAIAKIALRQGWDSKAEGALYFHAKRVSPNWHLQRVATVDNHIFYR